MQRTAVFTALRIIERFARVRLVTEKCASEQEKLKADLKTKTAEMDAELSAMKKLYAEAKKRVKLDIAQSQWCEYGIDDKR